MGAHTYMLGAVPGIDPGVEIDLTRVREDSVGAHWFWDRTFTPDGVPVMERLGRPEVPGGDTLLPLDQLVTRRGPLSAVPAVRPPDIALVHSVLGALADGSDEVPPPVPVRPVLRSPASTTTAVATLPATDPATLATRKTVRAHAAARRALPGRAARPHLRGGARLRGGSRLLGGAR
ncbi:phiSA1p31-related protein [Streptomyces zhihengii]|uniref:PhiSA1p31-related protein n=1 Tax=Streptomyces zhihengii TaxID=1818004 RepID=A0ABS2UU84_9ACTN|nr:phiSA1p31-related protein [Streptomyces zhihengii]MBM9620993.1 phiSA1p31-related protein [Streptomyces zhihengii]